MLFSIASNAQLSSGLVANWPFNGSVLDASGNGHTGIPINIVYTKGKKGVLNTAAYFNGTSSFVQVESKSDLNLSQYSFCVVLKPDSFYTGNCQSSRIITRGADSNPGSYNLELFDNAFDSSCVITNDTTHFTYNHFIGNNPCYFKNVQYSPLTRTKQWLCVICTWDGTTYKTYVDGVLKVTTTPYITTPTSTSADSLYMGAYRHNVSNPWWFKGAMDEVRIYNRPLSSMEIDSFCNLFKGGGESVETASAAYDVKLFPNPNKGSFNLLGNTHARTVKIDVINVLGQVVYSENAPVVNEELDKAINLNHVSNGMYYLILKTDTGNQSFKLIIEK
jgi:hypothetical protein